MSIKTVLFDLDGTLLPMDLDEFIQAYFKKITQWLIPYGYDPKELVDTIWCGTLAMMKNDGSQTNETVFWKVMEEKYGSDMRYDHNTFDRFYDKEFDKLSDICGFQPLAADIVHSLQQKGYQIILATNPIFPQAATHWRIRWAGLKPEDFCYITTYENASYSKPNLDYYRSILEMHHLKPEECLMVGNDATEDMVAQELGMEVFLLTECLLNKHKKDIQQYPNGDFYKLKQYIDQLPDLT